MRYLIPTGCVAALRYTHWRHNQKIYAFILYSGAMTDRIHALNLAALELNAAERAKLVRTIIRLSKVPAASMLTGRMLYMIFKKYHPQEVKKCYRTYLFSRVVGYSIAAPGLNKAEDVKPEKIGKPDPVLANQARADIILRALHLHSQRPSALAKVKAMFAGTPTKPAPAEPAKKTETPGHKDQSTKPDQGPSTTGTPEGGSNDSGGGSGGGGLAGFY